MLRYCLLLLLSPLASGLQPRHFHVPSVDFTQLSSAVNNTNNTKLLTILQENGIVALKNVPSYSVLRKEYLRVAVTCAVQAQKQDAEFLEYRQLRDGTNRYTVSLESGHELSKALDQSQDLLALCPEYVEMHAAFSAVVELAVASVGSALDATQQFHVVTEQGDVVMTARKLMEESVHLDNFHAYTATQGLQVVEDDSTIDVTDMSLELHTDHGLMIAMSAPEYFEELSNGEVHHKETSREDAGLFIQLTSGEIVRPMLNPNELILMLGSGIDNWIKTSPPLRSVLHGMRYPRGVSLVDGKEQGSKLLRSWFGKMVLLEAHHVMDNTGLTFGQYVNRTTRYLVEDKSEAFTDFAAVACPSKRRLQASTSGCSLRVCSLREASSALNLASSCQVTCNHETPESAALCEQHCDCEASPSSATACWMLCVANLSLQACPGEQVCNTATTFDELAMTCVAGSALPSADANASLSSNSISQLADTTSSTGVDASTTIDDPTTQLPPTPSSTAASSATSLLSAAIYVNVIASLVAVCIQ